MKVYVVELAMHYESHVDSVWTTLELAQNRVRILKLECPKESFNCCEIIEMELDFEQT